MTKGFDVPVQGREDFRQRGFYSKGIVVESESKVRLVKELG